MFLTTLYKRFINKLKKKEEAAAPAPAPVTTKECPYCKSTVHIDAVKCPHCLSELEVAEKAE